MYTLPKDTPITHQILNDVIEYNERFKKRFEMLERYYLGQHDSIIERNKDDKLSNNKVIDNLRLYL